MTMLLNPHRFATSGGGGGFTPADLDNKVGWWDFSQLALSNDDKIATATDRYGIRDATQGTTAHQPVFKTSLINGVSGSQWGASPDEVLFTPSDISASLPVSLWAVAKLDAVPAGSSIDRFIWDWSNSATVNAAMWADGGTGNWWVYNGSNISSVSADTDAHSFIAIYRADGSGELWIDGTQVATGTTGTRTLETEIALGRRGGGQSDAWDGAIGEIGAVADELTSQEISDLSDYLSSKWGL